MYIVYLVIFLLQFTSTHAFCIHKPTIYGVNIMHNASVIMKKTKQKICSQRKYENTKMHKSSKSSKPIAIARRCISFLFLILNDEIEFSSLHVYLSMNIHHDNHTTSRCSKKRHLKKQNARGLEISIYCCSFARLHTNDLVNQCSVYIFWNEPAFLSNAPFIFTRTFGNICSSFDKFV